MEARVFAEGLLQGEVALVTGGGTGIGRQIALHLAGLGAKVAICGRRREPLEETAQELRALVDAAGQVHLGTCDIRDYDQVKSFVNEAAHTYITLVRQFPMAAEAITPNGFAAVIRNNLIGTWHVTHAVATTCMIPQKKGRIVSITAQVAAGSLAWFTPAPARAGVENMTMTLAVEWSPYNINVRDKTSLGSRRCFVLVDKLIAWYDVNAVAPGVIGDSGTHRYAKEVVEGAIAKIPLQRHGRAVEVAHLATYLASPLAAYVTGQVFRIDGGQSLWGDLLNPHAMARL